MGVGHSIIHLDPCPQCGRPESARMGSSAWGHRFSCCSEECGRAFADSSKRWELELKQALQQRYSLNVEIRFFRAELRRAHEREAAPRAGKGATP